MNINQLLKLGLAMVAATGISALSLGPAQAQNGPRIQKNALEKTQWHVAPREIQIIDDRPVVRDFREAPQDAGSIELPPGPQAGGGGAGGGGAGALGGGPGSSIPAGGLQLGGPNQGFRTAGAGPMGALPKSGFGRETNIPARGILPKGPLGDGTSTNRMMGKMLNPGTAKGVGAGAPRGIQPTQTRSNGNYSGPAVQTYSGGYGSGSGSGYGGSASKTETMVRGSLLHK